jgi:hypothetical protein
MQHFVGENEVIVAIVNDHTRRQRLQHLGKAPPRVFRFRLAALHLGYVVVAKQPLAARQRRHRIEHGAAVGVPELSRRNIACANLGEPGLEVGFPFVVGNVVCVVLAADCFHQQAERRARRGVARRHLRKFPIGLVDDLGVEICVDQNHAHAQRVERPLEVGEMAFVGRRIP